MNLSFRPIQQCKKDNTSIKYEDINEARKSVDLHKTSNTIKNNEDNNSNNNINNKYNKEDFIEEFNKLHNDEYFNPYEILDIDYVYNPETLKAKYKEKALIYHPDKSTGNVRIFQDVTKSYLYLLKKYKENIPDKQIKDLKDDFEKHMNEEKGQQNILLNDKNFNVNKFNKIFSENNVKTDDDGYGNFMKNGVEKEETKETYIFSDEFNINIFNKLFNEKIKKKKKNEIQLYKEPETIVQTNSNYIEIGEDKVTDYSSAVGFNKNIHYTDCKVAYSEPEMLETEEQNNYKTLEELKDFRKDISYKMDEATESEYNEYIKLQKQKEEERQYRAKYEDLNILKKYNSINKILLQK